MNKTSLRISVAMCTYNGARFLDEQLKSIVAQTRTPDELIICDDCSSDSTVEIVNEFASQASFPVRLFVNEQTLGSTRNFERAAALCEGDLIAFSDQDDVWLPRKLEAFEAEFQKRPDVGLVFSDAEIVDEQLKSSGSRMWSQVGFGEKEKYLITHSRALDVLLPGWTITGATMAFRSKFRKLVLPIPIDLPMIHDGWIALMVATVAEIRPIDDALILYRQHRHQQIGAPVKEATPPGPQLTKLSAVKSAAHRNNSYSDLVRIIQEVKQRLTVNGNDPARQKSIDDVNKRLQHLNVRMHLSSRPWARLTPVLRELLAMRYHRFSNGAASAAKDLFYGARVGKQ